MPLFQKQQNLTDEQKKMNVVTFWLFVVAVFSWVIPFTVLFVLGLMSQATGGKSAFSYAFLPSVIALAITVVLCIIVGYAYRKLVLKQ